MPKTAYTFPEDTAVRDEELGYRPSFTLWPRLYIRYHASLIGRLHRYTPLGIQVAANALVHNGPAKLIPSSPSTSCPSCTMSLATKRPADCRKEP